MRDILSRRRPPASAAAAAVAVLARRAKRHLFALRVREVNASPPPWSTKLWDGIYSH